MSLVLKEKEKCITIYQPLEPAALEEWNDRLGFEVLYDINI